MNEVDLKVYNQALNDYHINLIDVAMLSAHLLDLGIDNSEQSEWYRAACHMMRNRLVELAEALPFPGMFPKSDLG